MSQVASLEDQTLTVAGAGVWEMFSGNTLQIKFVGIVIVGALRVSEVEVGNVKGWLNI